MPGPAPAPVPVPQGPPPGLYLMAGPLGGKGNIDGAVGRFTQPAGLAISPTGVLLVMDSGALRSVTQLAGGDSQVATLPQPDSLGAGSVFDAAGNRYGAVLSTITRTAPNGATTTFAGAPDQSGHADGTGGDARFGVLSGLAIDAGGNLYASDSMHATIRKITPAGVVTTFASLPAPAQEIAVDGAGNVYAAIRNAIHRYGPSGAGTVLLAESDAPGSLRGIAGMTADKDGNLFVAEEFGCSVQKISPAGVMATFAGKSEEWGSADGVGGQARFCEFYANGLRGLVADAAGNLYTADHSNATIRKITPAGAVSTIAGKATTKGQADGSGSAARFDTPFYFYQLTADAQGNVYVGEGPRIRKVSASGMVSTLNLPATGPTGKPVSYSPGQLAAGGRAVAFSDAVLSRVDQNGSFSFLAGQAGVFGNADGTGAQATLRTADRMTMDGQGNLYFVDSVPVAMGTMLTLRPVYRKVKEAGAVSTLPGSDQMAVTQWTAAYDGSLVAAVNKGALAYEVSRIAPDGARSVLLSVDGGTEAGWVSAVAVDRQDNVYVAEWIRTAQGDGARIRKITPAGTVTIVAGQAGKLGVRPGALPAALNTVEAMTVGADGVLYIMSENSLLRIVQ